MRMDALSICALIGLLLVLLGSPGQAKTERTLYTPEQIENIRDNLEQYDWAKAIRSSAVASAAKYLEMPDEELAKYVPDPRIPRSIYVHETGCPNCGLAMRKTGNYSWIISQDLPYKVKCPNCGKVYPDSDYQAFIATDFKDRSVLKGEIVDDGWGWASPKYGEKHKYWFVAWYNHWMTSRLLPRAINSLSDAYLYTDDPKYAHKSAVLLWQLAKYYPDYDYAKQSRIGTEINHGYNGRLLYHTWETGTVRNCSRAYDAIFPALLERDVELEQLTGQTMEEIRHLIEEQLLRSMAREIVDETMYIAGNYGSHQVGLLQIAAVLKDTPGSPSSQEMIDWMLNNEEYRVYTMMPIYDALYNLVYRDGVPFESPGYNLGWVNSLTIIADLLRVNDVDLSRVPRFKKLYDWTIDMVCAGDFTPALGDSGNMSNRGRMWRENIFLSAYNVYQDPLYAKIVLDLNANAGRDITAAPLTEKLQQAAAQVETKPGYEDRHLPGYGLATLQNENHEHPIAMSLFYGRFVGHSHRDKMHLDIFAENCSVMPDFGYPETANSTDPRRAGFFAHTISHNTVLVDKRPQAGERGRCLAYDTGPVCQYVEAQNDNVYEQCEMYRRSVAMVEVSPDQSYFIDIFRVKGGQQHDWLVHGSHADLESTLDLSQPREGTLAGPDVEYGYFYDDKQLADVPYGSTSYFSYRGSSFQFLYNVQEAALKPGASARWNFITSGDRAAGIMKANEGAYLKAFLVGEDEQLFVCDGKPQQNQQGTPDSVKFLVRRRTGENLNSTFTTVFEPGADDEIIRSVTPLSTGNDDLVALKLELNSGATHYYFNATEPVEEIEVADGIRFAGQVGYLALDARGEVEKAYLHNATLLGKGDWRLEGEGPARTTIASCDYQENSVTLAEPVLAEREAVGSTAIINCGAYGSSFVVKGVEGDSKLLFGDQEPICSRAFIKEIKAEQRQLLTPTTLYFVQPTMHVVNEAFEPVAKVLNFSFSDHALTTEGDFSAAQLADTDGDGAIRAYIMEYGPGDSVLLPASIRYQRN